MPAAMESDGQSHVAASAAAARRSHDRRYVRPSIPSMKILPSPPEAAGCPWNRAGMTAHFEKTGIRKRRYAAPQAPYFAKRGLIKRYFSRRAITMAVTPIAPVALSFMTESLFCRSCAAVACRFDGDGVEGVGEGVQVKAAVDDGQHEEHEAACDGGGEEADRDQGRKGAYHPLQGPGKRKKRSRAGHIPLASPRPLRIRG